jgi:hypothetical protein
MCFDNDKVNHELYRELLDEVFSMNDIVSAYRQDSIIDAVKRIVAENIKISYRQGYREGLQAKNILN